MVEMQYGAGIQYDVKVVSDGKFLGNFNPEGIEKFLNNGVVSNGVGLGSNHLNRNSSEVNSDISFLVFGQNGTNGNSSYVGALVSKSKEIDGFGFEYYDTVAVAPEYVDNDVMKEMLGFARLVGNMVGEVPPALSITDNPVVDKVYGTMSDVSMKIGDVYVHGFGFFDNETRKPLFDGAEEKFELAATYVAALPQTLVKTSPE